MREGALNTCWLFMFLKPVMIETLQFVGLNIPFDDGLFSLDSQYKMAKTSLDVSLKFKLSIDMVGSSPDILLKNKISAFVATVIAAK